VCAFFVSRTRTAVTSLLIHTGILSTLSLDLVDARNLLASGWRLRVW